MTTRPTRIRVAILFGGRSGEHEISLRSARSVVAAIDRDRFEVSLVGIDQAGAWHLLDEPAFLALTKVPGRTRRGRVLRGRENSFPEAFIAKVNSMGRGVTAEFVQLGGTKLNEPVPYRVVLDRMSHEVPYYSVYLKMAALQGTYCINNTFGRTADDKFFGYAIAEHLGIAEPKTCVLPNVAYVDDVSSESLRNLWPTDLQMYADFVGLPCIMKPAFGGGWKDVHKITNMDELRYHYYASGSKTMMLVH